MRRKRVDEEADRLDTVTRRAALASQCAQKNARIFREMRSCNTVVEATAMRRRALDNALRARAHALAAEEAIHGPLGTHMEYSRAIYDTVKAAFLGARAAESCADAINEYYGGTWQ